MAVFKASELESTPIIRFPSGLHEFDRMMGHTDGLFGMPLGMITVIAAPAGMGKTRFLTLLSKTLIESTGGSVFFAQSEVTPAQFASEKLGHLSDNVKDKFYISPSTDLMGQVSLIRQVKPKLVIIDSAQQIDEFKSGRGAKDVVRAYRDVLVEVGAHAIFVSQQNADGSAKGGTEFAHEVDIVIKGRPGRLKYADIGDDRKAVYSEKIPSTFSLVIDDKHRYGKTPIESLWKHEEKGVVTGAHYRLSDSKYMENPPMNDGIAQDRKQTEVKPEEVGLPANTKRGWLSEFFA